MKKVTFLVYICTKYSQCTYKNENIEIKHVGIFLIIFKSLIAEYIFIKKRKSKYKDSNSCFFFINTLLSNQPLTKYVIRQCYIYSPNIKSVHKKSALHHFPFAL